MTKDEIQLALKHFLAFVFAILLFAAGSLILYANMKALTVALLIAIGACYAFALLLAIPMEAKQATTFIIQFLPDSLVGGRRKTDPPAPPSAP